jgi:glycosyltransferase involved in cell wall biosynthesis
MKRIKVLHLIGSMDLGGAEKQTRLIVEGLGADEFEAAVLCIKSGGFNAGLLCKKGYHVEELLGIHKTAPVSIFLLLKAAWRLFKFLRREKPNILHSHLFAASCLGRVVGKIAGVKCIIVTLHRIEYPRSQPWIERFLTPLTTLYITDSKSASTMLSNILKIPRDMIRVVYNGIDRAEFSSPPTRDVARSSLGFINKDFVIGVIAHLYWEKGHIFLLESLARVKDKIPGLKLLIVGDGSLREELQRKAQQLLPVGSVIFLGQREDLANILSALDLFVLPSSWEGFGIVLAESMYMSVPVVTTRDGGGCAEVVEENDGGLLVNYGDTNALGEAIVRLFSDNSLRNILGNRGRTRVERCFTSEEMCAQYAAIYSGFKNIGP